VERRRLLGLLATAAAAGLIAGIPAGRGWIVGRLVPTATGPDRYRDVGRLRPEPAVGRPVPDPHPKNGTEVSDDQDAPSGADDRRAATLAVISRDALGLAPARSGGRSHVIERLTLHHSAVRLAEMRLAPSRLRGHQDYHLAQGWPDVAYHYGVDPAGNVYALRDPSIASDTFTDYDPAGHLSIVCEGDFGAQAPTHVMLASVALLVAALADRHGVSPTTLGAHRDHAATACPGDGLHRALPALRRRAEAHVRAGGLTIDLLDGAAGAVRVAVIEAGG
jgi:hypothetical protein